MSSSNGLLSGKRILITGVLTDASLAFGVARRAQAEGAELVLSGAGRGLSLTRRTARKLETPVDVIEIDVADPNHLVAAAANLTARWGRLDGILHAIGFAPQECLGGDILRADWEQVAVALQISTYSLKALVGALRPLLVAAGSSSVVALDFDARVAWPAYDWMGVAKAALESLARYLARDLGPEGVRVNLVAAGPVRTMAAKSIPSFKGFEDTWGDRAPLGWDVNDSEPVARACVALLSDWFPMTTGEMVHVDGASTPWAPDRRNRLVPDDEVPMTKSRAEEFRAAGIYDPDAVGAPERLELLEYLDGRGVALEAMVESDGAGALAALASELPLRAPGAPLSIEAVATAAATTVDRVRRVRLAAGLPADLGDPGHPGLPPTVVNDVVSFEAGAALFGEAPTLSFTRVMGAAVARIAEAAVSLFLTERMPALGTEATELARARAAEDGTATFIALTPELMANLLREHMTLAVRRSVTERTLEVDERAVTVGLGFVDLVGSTPWAAGLTLKAHAMALAGFESAAWDIASAHGGRVVKLIGDETMFLAPTGADAARIALELCRAVAADDELPEARAAVGYGTVGARDGDYFGPLVNLVARAVKVADPGAVVLTETVRDDLGDSPAAGERWEVVELSARQLRGIGEPVRLFALR